MWRHDRQRTLHLSRESGRKNRRGPKRFSVSLLEATPGLRPCIGRWFHSAVERERTAVKTIRRHCHARVGPRERHHRLDAVLGLGGPGMLGDQLAPTGIVAGCSLAVDATHRAPGPLVDGQGRIPTPALPVPQIPMPKRCTVADVLTVVADESFGVAKIGQAENVAPPHPRLGDSPIDVVRSQRLAWLLAVFHPPLADQCGSGRHSVNPCPGTVKDRRKRLHQLRSSPRRGP